MENLNNENQENQEQKNDEIKISKRSLYIAFSIIGALILGVSGYFVFFGKNTKIYTFVTTWNTTLQKSLEQ